MDTYRVDYCWKNSKDDYGRSNYAIDLTLEEAQMVSESLWLDDVYTIEEEVTAVIITKEGAIPCPTPIA